MAKVKTTDRLQWAAERARTFLLSGERSDGFADGTRIGVLAAIVSRRYKLTDDEAVSLARRAFELLVVQGHATHDGRAYWATKKLRTREPHEGINLTMRARTWRTLGYALPSDVSDYSNVKNVVRDEETGAVSYEVVRD